jgi:cytochrome c553
MAAAFSASALAAGDEDLSQRIGKGDPAAGKHKLESLVCRECHGEDGVSISLMAPNLAGQFADYIIKQVHAFQSGHRDNPTMDMMAPTIDDAALVDVAAFFASNPRAPGEISGKSNDAAKALFENGDSDRGVLACQSCHGPEGKGTEAGGVFYPLIAGQRFTYLRDQLNNWKTGERSNSPDGVMNHIAAGLTDREVESLARYISGL